MSDEIEQRLAAAAQAAREHDLCGQQHAQLRARERAAAEDLDAAKQDYAGEEKEVERLEHLSLTRVLAALHGSRADTLAREKAQADAARYRVVQAQQHLDAAQAELSSLEDRQAQLASAPQEYAAALAAKEQFLTQSADPRGARLLALAEQAARTADQRLAALRTDLADIGGYEPTAPRLEVTAGFKFADIFFNNIFTDLAVGHQIRDAQDNADRSLQQVRALQDQLRDQTSTVTKRLDAMDAERQQLLTQ